MDMHGFKAPAEGLSPEEYGLDIVRQIFHLGVDKVMATGKIVVPFSGPSEYVTDELKKGNCPK